MNILIDTNIALYLLGGDSRIAEILDGQIVHVSFVTELEPLGYPGLNKRETKLINDFLEDCVIIDINKRIKDYTIEFLKNYKLKIPDGIIAATSAYLGIPLMSADTDFMSVKEIDFLAYKQS